ncbi:hypothetical protein MNV49_000823 [Pseudohyphozyma bogoriensis]|nr:hypothetical protein MNV49_000823 [Pseudohyphozyma bogoriensis]
MVASRVVSEPPLSTRTGTIPPPSRPRSRRTTSAPTSPLFLAHHFPAPPPSFPSKLPHLETKHSGTGALKRIFLGPHLVKKDAAGQGHKVDTEDDGSSSESESSDDDDDDEIVDADERARRDARRRAKVRRAFERKIKRQQRIASGQTVGSALTTEDHKGGHHWTGDSFEIGGDARDAARRRSEMARRRASDADGATTFVTAASSFASGANLPLDPTKDYSLSPPPKHIEEKVPELAHQLLRRPSDIPFRRSTSHGNPTPDSSTHLLTAEPKSILRTKGSKLGFGHPSSSAASPPAPSRVLSSRTIQFPSAPPAGNSTPIHAATSQMPHAGDLPPAPVEEVLARHVDETGELAGQPRPILKNTVSFPPPRPGQSTRTGGKDEVLRKERMLVRAEWTEREDLPDAFNERSARRFKTFHQGWEEYAVVWRPKRLELFTEYSFPPAELFTGHKKLKHTIPLVSPRTKLSLYSSPDLIFCLTHQPSPHHVLSSIARQVRSPEKEEYQAKKANKGGALHFRHDGTNIYVIRAKNSSIAKEWIWHLYTTLGGNIPKSLDISVPGLGARIHLPIPELRGDEREGEGYKLLTHKAVVKAAVDQLESVTDFREIVGVCKSEGVELRLAWRRGEILDWVEMGDEHEWAVVIGWALRQPEVEPVLEMRPALHYPTTVRLPSTPTEPATRISEPPGVEGYLTRMKPNGNSSERIYLSSHDGHLFLCRPSTASPPDPPLPVRETLNNPASLVLMPFMLGFATIGGDRKKKDKAWEKIMGRKRVEKKKKKAGQGVAVDEDEDEDEDADIMGIWEKHERKRLIQQIIAARGYVDLRDVESIGKAEVEDGETHVDIPDPVGGQKAIDEAEDKKALRRQRSFVVTTKTGMKVRFEAHSTSVAAEWIGRLNALRDYWIRRERVDAQEQMAMVPPSHSIPSLRRLERERERSDLPPEDDDDVSFPLLSKIYNWCVIDSCRSILAAGRLYVRKGARGRFKERYLFLLPGVLLEYDVRKRDVNGQPTQRVYHQRVGTFSLNACYVYSGRLASSILSPSVGTSWDIAEGTPQFPRMYEEDGLRTTDGDEDCTLVLFKKSRESRGLGKKGTILVLRARSMLERDEWVFSLGEAISKLQHVEREKEEKLREFPWLKKV